MSRTRNELICCLMYGTALALSVAASLGSAVNDKKCGSVAIMGCGDVAPFPCDPWSGYPCSQGGGTSTHKKGTNFPYNLCYAKKDFNCEEVPVVCFKDQYYKDSGCTVFCAEYPAYIDGCIPPA